MLILPWKILFACTLVSGSILALSASSWLMVWIGLEINLMSLLALFLNEKSPRNAEAVLKYFLIQALASAILIFSASMMTFSFLFFSTSFFFLLIILSLFTKLGAAPFHFWVPQVAEGLNWSFLFILLSWQKLAPLMLIIYCTKNFSYHVMILVIVMSAIVGSIMGLTFSSTRKIIAFSSINHLAWLLTAALQKFSSWVFYYIIYITLLMFLLISLASFNLSSISTNWSSEHLQSKLVCSSLLLSFGGLPPFVGFLPKWLVISDLMLSEFNLLTIILVLSSLISLFYYLRISLSSFLHFSSSSHKTFLAHPLINTSLSFNMLGIAFFPLIFFSI